MQRERDCVTLAGAGDVSGDRRAVVHPAFIHSCHLSSVSELQTESNV